MGKNLCPWSLLLFWLEKRVPQCICRWRSFHNFSLYLAVLSYAISPSGTPVPGPLEVNELIVNGLECDVRWCVKCEFYRPPRSRHCRRCDICVEVRLSVPILLIHLQEDLTFSVHRNLLIYPHDWNTVGPVLFCMMYGTVMPWSLVSCK